MAHAWYLTPEQRAHFVEDPSRNVVAALIDFAGMLAFGSWELPEPPLPRWAYERIIERYPQWGVLALMDDPFVPQDIQERLGIQRTAPTPEVPLTRAQAEAMVATDNEYSRAQALADPRVPAGIAARFTNDPAHEVRLAVSLRPELTEHQRQAIDYHVGPDDRLRPTWWATTTEDPEVQRTCALSAHIGLRRSVALNQHLSPELVPILAEDTDFAVRLLLCEYNATVAPQRVVTTFLEATTMTAGRLLDHPRLRDFPFASLAEDPHPGARALVPRDPNAAPGLIERLSHDEYAVVRARMASDRRLSPARVLELFDADETTEAAAANPHLPVDMMELILADAVALAGEVVEGKPAVYLGRWNPDTLPDDDE
ncbi:hypothetical protein [Actinoplanes sp. TFC3]|uniref:hypothetical protein n=1 Tax=Actinoplanes sp. TFC3 TaxID=1710355 RepID=UPI00082CF9F7|nr:hypothetical protein [Actinoplanes sp. TFC3]